MPNHDGCVASRADSTLYVEVLPAKLKHGLEMHKMMLLVFVALLAVTSRQGKAEVRYDSFLELCGTLNELCHGFLWGVLESSNSQNERIRRRLIDNNFQVPPAWIFISTDWCFPQDYKKDMDRSLSAFLERVRIDVVAEMPRQYQALGLDNPSTDINNPGPNLLTLTMETLYGCSSGSSLRNRLWGSP